MPITNKQKKDTKYITWFQETVKIRAFSIYSFEYLGLGKAIA